MTDVLPAGQRTLRDLLDNSLLEIAEVHSGLSARLAEDAGFEAIWASSFALSSLMGVRDCDEASPNELLTIIDWILGSSGAALLVDGNSGFGSFNTARRFACELARRGVAGVCFEDKCFPKRNSFIGNDQQLLSISEFEGIIAAAREATSSSTIMIVARTEALIAGRSMCEALDRAHAYANAGAHAILIHSKIASDEEVIAFGKAWNRRTPIIIVPTTYPDINRDRLMENGISSVIWANQALRASTYAMKRLYKHIKLNGRPTGFSDLSSMQDLFTTLNYAEFENAALRFGANAAS